MHDVEQVHGPEQIDGASVALASALDLAREQAHVLVEAVLVEPRAELRVGHREPRGFERDASREAVVLEDRAAKRTFLRRLLSGHRSSPPWANVGESAKSVGVKPRARRALARACVAAAWRAAGLGIDDARLDAILSRARWSAALPEALLESEMFGHVKGAFTGANQDKTGLFEEANGGTIFLDEIGDMPLAMQARLLRVLQENQVTPVGSSRAIRTDVRIIAATHRDLKILTRQGLFREDLFYRLNVVPVRVPPLRERVDDIGDLVRHFLDQAATEGLPHKILDQSALEELRHHRWPGNVRELENLARRLAALYPYDTISADTIKAELAENPHQMSSLSGDATSAGADSNEGLGSVVERQLRNYFDAHRNDMPASGLYDRIIREVEKPLIELTLNLTRGNQIKAAYLLGLNRNTLRKKIRDLDIDLIRGVK